MVRELVDPPQVPVGDIGVAAVLLVLGRLLELEVGQTQEPVQFLLFGGQGRVLQLDVALGPGPGGGGTGGGGGQDGPTGTTLQRAPVPLYVVLGGLVEEADALEDIRYVVYPPLLYCQEAGGFVQIQDLIAIIKHTINFPPSSGHFSDILCMHFYFLLSPPSHSPPDINV